MLYDVGSHNGTSYLVMEYREGETLAERLHKGSCFRVADHPDFAAEDETGASTTRNGFAQQHLAPPILKRNEMLDIQPIGASHSTVPEAGVFDSASLVAKVRVD